MAKHYHSSFLHAYLHRHQQSPRPDHRAQMIHQRGDLMRLDGEQDGVLRAGLGDIVGDRRPREMALASVRLDQRQAARADGGEAGAVGDEGDRCARADVSLQSPNATKVDLRVIADLVR